MGPGGCLEEASELSAGKGEALGELGDAGSPRGQAGGGHQAHGAAPPERPLPPGLGEQKVAEPPLPGPRRVTTVRPTQWPCSPGSALHQGGRGPAVP